jgi:hypothetical protein
MPALSNEPYKAIVIEMLSNDNDMVRLEVSPSIYNVTNGTYGCKAIAYSPANIEYRRNNIN